MVSAPVEFECLPLIEAAERVKCFVDRRRDAPQDKRWDGYAFNLAMELKRKRYPAAEKDGTREPPVAFNV